MAYTPVTHRLPGGTKIHTTKEKIQEEKGVARGRGRDRENSSHHHKYREKREDVDHVLIVPKKPPRKLKWSEVIDRPRVV